MGRGECSSAPRISADLVPQKWMSFWREDQSGRGGEATTWVSRLLQQCWRYSGAHLVGSFAQPEETSPHLLRRPRDRSKTFQRSKRLSRKPNAPPCYGTLPVVMRSLSGKLRRDSLMRTISASPFTMLVMFPN